MKKLKRMIATSMCALMLLGLVTGCSDKGTAVDDTSKQQETGGSVESDGNKSAEPQLNVGQEFAFGTYEQDGDVLNGAEPIEWKVLAVEDGKALLISKCVLDWQKYNETDEKVNWSTCSLRVWMNRDFYNNAFNIDEKNRIEDTLITSDGAESTDAVFLLNKTEMETYFHSDAERISEPTEVVKFSAKDTQNSTFENKEGCWYWVCGNGTIDKAPYISKKGIIKGNTDYVDWNYGVRPAIWIIINTDSE